MDDAKKGSKNRSPNYPAMSLVEAVRRVRQVYDAEPINRMPQAVVAAHLGYGGLNGSSMTVVSALRKYGLLEGDGESLKVSRDAIAILEDPSGSRERLEAVKRAALRPPLFAELAAEFEASPSEETLRAHLKKNGYTPSAADAATRSYRDTLTLVTQVEAEYRLSEANKKQAEDEQLNKAKEHNDDPPNDPPPRRREGFATFWPPEAALEAPAPQERERLRLNLSGDRTVRLIFGGPPPTQAEIDELVDYLKVSRRTFPATKATDSTSMPENRAHGDGHGEEDGKAGDGKATDPIKA